MHQRTWGKQAKVLFVWILVFSSIDNGRSKEYPECYVNSHLKLRKGERLEPQIQQFCQDNHLRLELCSYMRQVIAEMFPLGVIQLPLKIVRKKGKLIGASFKFPLATDATEISPFEVLDLGNSIRKEQEPACATSNYETKYLELGPLDDRKERIVEYCTTHNLGDDQCNKMVRGVEAYLVKRSQSKTEEIISPFKMIRVEMNFTHNVNFKTEINGQMVQVSVDSFDSASSIADPLCLKFELSEGDCDRLHFHIQQKRFKRCGKRRPGSRHGLVQEDTDIKIDIFRDPHEQIRPICESHGIPESMCKLLELQASSIVDDDAINIPIRVLVTKGITCAISRERLRLSRAFSLKSRGYSRMASNIYHRYLRVARGTPWNERPSGQSPKSFFQLRRLQAASRVRVLELTRELVQKKVPFDRPGEAFGISPMSVMTRGNMVMATRHKLRHDEEQIRYLVQQNLLPPEFKQYAKELQNAHLDSNADLNSAFLLSIKKYNNIGYLYNTAVYIPPGPLPGTIRQAVNPGLDFESITQKYFSDGGIGVAVIDNFLTPEALKALLDYCLEATIFYEIKAGYLGAYFHEGLSNDLLCQIEDELRVYLPEIMSNFTLTNLWAYKYDSDLEGIKIHADNAAVNFNFWITPDEANLDPATGGLNVYTKAAPLEEDLARFNTIDQKGIDNMFDFLKKSKSEKLSIPYRQNRAVLFNSNLLHETQRFTFKKGYKNRRINITMLFGNRQKHIPQRPGRPSKKADEA